MRGGPVQGCGAAVDGAEGRVLTTGHVCQGGEASGARKDSTVSGPPGPGPSASTRARRARPPGAQGPRERTRWPHRALWLRDCRACRLLPTRTGAPHLPGVPAAPPHPGRFQRGNNVEQTHPRPRAALPGCPRDRRGAEVSALHTWEDGARVTGSPRRQNRARPGLHRTCSLGVV